MLFMITVGKEQMDWHQGMTIAQVLSAMAEGHKYAVVKLNGKPVSKPHFDTTLVPDGAEILLMPMISGG